MSTDIKAPAPPHVPHPPCPDPDSPTYVHQEFVTAGKVGHNELTYRVVDFGLNSTIGVGTTYATARTEAGRKYFAEPVENFFKTVLKPVLTSEASLKEGAKWGSLFTSIIVGGMSIIPLMVQLEKRENKKSIIRWIDEKWYGKERVENDPSFAASYQCIDEEPKKSFATGMAARIMVLVPMIGVTIHPEANKQMVKYLYNPVAKGSKYFCEAVGVNPGKLLQRGQMEHINGDLTQPQQFLSDWDFIHRTIGFDLGLTFIYSFAHEAAIKSLAAMGFKRNEEEAPPHAPLPPGGAVTATADPATPKPEVSLASVSRSNPVHTEVRA